MHKCHVGKNFIHLKRFSSLDVLSRRIRIRFSAYKPSNKKLSIYHLIFLTPTGLGLASYSKISFIIIVFSISLPQLKNQKWRALQLVHLQSLTSWRGTSLCWAEWDWLIQRESQDLHLGFYQLLPEKLIPSPLKPSRPRRWWSPDLTLCYFLFIRNPY